MKDLEVFVLKGEDGRLLPPAVQATVLAKYSRSPLSAKEIVKGVTPEDAEAFQKKWGVEYGHSSVAELATVPYCFEDVSIVASKFLEQYQRAGYSEKSTRYQQFSRESFIMPPGGDPLIQTAANLLYDTYTQLEQPLYEHLAKKAGIPLDGPMHKPTKARAFDSLRYLLPAGTGTKLAAVLNARDARYMMSDLLGSDLPELREIGAKMVAAAGELAPVFAMGVKPNDFEPRLVSLGPVYEDENGEDDLSRVRPGVVFRGAIPSPEEDEHFYAMVRESYGMSRPEFDELMKKRGNRQVPNIFKAFVLQFEIFMDYGAYRDLQRHRRCEQFVEPLSPKYGYVVPDDILGTEFETPFRGAVQAAFGLCVTMLSQGHPLDNVQYALPLATLHRSIFQMDMKELYYITELRTQPQGHISYRRAAWQMYQEAKRRFPRAMKWCQAIQPISIGEHK